MTGKETVKLLALDRRTPRFPSVQPRSTIFDMYVSSRAEAAQLRTALRRYIEITEAPEEGKWNWATLREMQQIRALAGFAAAMKKIEIVGTSGIQAKFGWPCFHCGKPKSRCTRKRRCCAKCKGHG